MPFMIPFIPYIVAAGAAVSAYGAYQQGQAAKKSADFNAEVAQQNAELAVRDARMRATQSEREKTLRLGAIRASAGASGGSTGEGSVLDVLGDVAAQSELEKQDILYRGEAAKRGYTNTATLDKFQGSYASQAGYLRAGSELLGGAGRMYGSNLTRDG